MLRLRRPSGLPPFTVLAAPLRPNDMIAADFGAPVVALFVSDPARAVAPPQAAPAAAMGLTPAEARVVGRLLAGEGIKDAADALQVSLSTARTHLQSVLDKTGTSRQAELVRLALTSLPHINLGDLQ